MQSSIESRERGELKLNSLFQISPLFSRRYMVNNMGKIQLYFGRGKIIFQYHSGIFQFFFAFMLQEKIKDIQDMMCSKLH